MISGGANAEGHSRAASRPGFPSGELSRVGAARRAAAKAQSPARARQRRRLDDEMIKRNPCRIKGVDREESPERRLLTVAQVYALADTVGLRYRALILLAAFTSLRWAELAKSKAAEPSGTRTARERKEPGEPAIDTSPDPGT